MNINIVSIKCEEYQFEIRGHKQPVPTLGKTSYLYDICDFRLSMSVSLALWNSSRGFYLFIYVRTLLSPVVLMSQQ